MYNFLVSQINFQKTLFGIYTKESVRKEFLAYPETFLKKQNLGRREAEALLKLPQKTLNMFAESLFGKKDKIFKKILGSNPRLIVASSAYLNGPILSFKKNSDLKNINIKQSEFELLKNLPELAFDLRGLFKSYLKAENAGVSHFIKLSLLANKESLWNRKIKII